MKIEEIIGSLLDQIDDRESLIPPDDPDSIFKHDAEALREAVKILRAVEKEEKRIEVVGKVCGNCAKWEWDAATKNGGFCPLPIRNRPGRKYKTRRTKACLQFEEKKEEAQGRRSSNYSSVRYAGRSSRAKRNARSAKRATRKNYTS